MYHLIIEELGVKRCIAKSESDTFSEGMFIDCAQDMGCIPGKYIREINIVCTANPTLSKKAKIYSD